MEQRGRPFEPGNKTGRGRPAGSRNKAASATQELFDKYAPHITMQCLTLAKNGDRSALRLCMERIVAPLRDPSVRFKLPRIRTAGDLDKAAQKVLSAMSRGRVTAADAEKAMNALSTHSKLIETAQMECRIARLEKELKAEKKEP